MIDALRDIQTLPGGEFMAACIDAVEKECRNIRRREESAAERGQAVCPENLRQAALLAAAAEMIAVLKSQGDWAASEGKEPHFVVKRAVSFGRAAFQKIDRGVPRQEAA